MAVLYVIPVIIEIHGHLFEVFTLVSEIHDNVDLVLGMKNAYELEGIVDMRHSSFYISKQVSTIFSKEQTIVKIVEIYTTCAIVSVTLPHLPTESHSTSDHSCLIWDNYNVSFITHLLSLLSLVVASVIVCILFADG